MKISMVCKLCLVLTVPWLCNAKMVDMSAYSTLVTMIHNFYRHHEHAANMKKLEWDNGLQKKAEAWAKRCHWGHQSKGFGENLAFHWTTGKDKSPIEVVLESVRDWWKESLTWKWQTNCGSACHYTQVIWADTAKVGCALNKCANLHTGYGQGVPGALYLVCFYDPPGNFIGRYPYIRGDRCTKCAKGETCQKGLCSKTSSLTDLRFLLWR